MMFEGDGGVAAEKVYAKFSSTRKGTQLTLSNADLTVTTDSITYGQCYFDTDKTSGIWAIEISSDIALAPNRELWLGGGNGLNDLSTATGLIGLYMNSMGWLTRLGTNYYNNAGSGNVWDAVGSNMVSSLLFCFDFDQRTILAPKAGVLIPHGIGRGPIEGTDQLFLGLSTRSNSAGTAISFTANTGETAFTAGNEILISDYETANSVTINRGLWQ